MFSWIRAHSRLLAPIAIVIAFATIAVSPAEALWSSVATPRVAVEAVGPGPQVADTSVPTATEQAIDPNATPEPCDQQGLKNIEFSGHNSFTGDGPFDATLHVTNDGDDTVHDLIAGFVALDGSEFLTKVIIDPGHQWWDVSGDPENIYAIGDLEPGDTVDVVLHIKTNDDWTDADADAKVVIGAGIFQADCDNHGDHPTIRLRRGDSQDQTQVPELTREPHRTKTSVARTPTPGEETTETPTPVTTDTATATATATSTATTVGVARVSTATPTSVPTKLPATKTPSPVSTTLAAASSPGPSNHVLGTDAVPPPTGQALPATGSGLPGPTGSRLLATLVLLAVAAGFVTIAAGVGRRVT